MLHGNSHKRASIIIGLAALFSALGISSESFCALVIDLPDITVLGSNVTPTNGVLEVFLTLTGPELASPPPASSFNLDFSTDGSGLTFAGAQNATTTPLFPSPGFFFSFGSATNVKAAADITPGNVPTFNNAGMIKVPFTVAAGNLGTTYHLNFGPFNEISYTNGSTVTTYPLSLIGGSIFVTVPEAAAVKQFSALVSVLAIGAVAAKVRRRRVAR